MKRITQKQKDAIIASKKKQDLILGSLILYDYPKLVHTTNHSSGYDFNFAIAEDDRSYIVIATHWLMIHYQGNVNLRDLMRWAQKDNSRDVSQDELDLFMSGKTDVDGKREFRITDLYKAISLIEADIDGS